MPLTRYRLQEMGLGAAMVSSPNGEYVRYNDIEPLFDALSQYAGEERRNAVTHPYRHPYISGAHEQPCLTCGLSATAHVTYEEATEK